MAGEKKTQELDSDYRRASGLHRAVSEHFASFRKMALNPNPNSPIKVEANADGSFSMQFLDREIRVSLSVDYAKGRGLIVVEDPAVSRPGNRKPITTIEFGGDGYTEFDGGYHKGKVNIAEEVDRLWLMAHVVDVALRHPPLQ